MITRVYEIRFSDSLTTFNNRYDIMDEDDKDDLFDLEAGGSFDYEDDDEYYIFLIITTESELIKIKNILNKYEFDYDVDDLSDEILNNSDEIHTILNNIKYTDEVNFEMFVCDLDEWIYNNLTIDIILDKINRYGIDKLSEIDKIYLYDNSNKLC